MIQGVRGQHLGLDPLALPVHTLGEDQHIFLFDLQRHGLYRVGHGYFALGHLEACVPVVRIAGSSLDDAGALADGRHRALAIHGGHGFVAARPGDRPGIFRRRYRGGQLLGFASGTHGQVIPIQGHLGNDINLAFRKLELLVFLGVGDRGADDALA